MDEETIRRCSIVSNAICAGTEHSSSFQYCTAFAVNVAAQVAERVRLSDNLEVEAVPTITGSSSELYIEPMLSCIEDYDVMYYFSNQLAFPAGHLLLPSECNNFTDVREIRDSGSGISNYVHLTNIEEETTSVETVQLSLFETRTAVRVQRRVAALSNVTHSPIYPSHGPAIVQDTAHLLNNHGRFFKQHVKSDFVACVRCPFWPIQADEWPFRTRHHNWPYPSTIELIVQQGCDVVPVSHPWYRDDTSQWRLSFSRAEVLLLNTWTPVQQIVYHMLRFFVKTKQLTSSSTAAEHCTDHLSVYHVKTLMLWACEEWSLDWWSSENVISFCRTLLSSLGALLSEPYCKHYFIHDCNLLQYIGTTDSRIEYTIHLLISVTDLELAEWFVQFYVKRYVKIECPHDIKQLFMEIKTSKQLERALSATVEWRSEEFRARSFGQLESAVSDVSTFLSGAFTARTCTVYYNERSKLGPLYDVFVACVFLKCAGEIKAGRCLYNRILHVLAVVFGNDSGETYDVLEKFETITVETLQQLMIDWRRRSLTGSSRTWRSINTELTKAFLHLARRRRDRHSDRSVNHLADIHEATLCYAAGNMHAAIDICDSVTTATTTNTANNQEPVQVDGRVFCERDSLITTTSGLVRLYEFLLRHILAASLDTNSHASSYAGDVIVRFIAARCYQMCGVTAETCEKLYESVQQYQKCIIVLSGKLFITDILLFRLVRAECPKMERWRVDMCWSMKSPMSTADYDPSKLSELLISSAVDRLTAFRQFEVREFGSDYVAVTTDFEALYAYRSGEYERCLSMSRDIVESVILMRSVPPVWIDSPQLVLMDDDIASIVGLLALMKPVSCTTDKLATQLAMALYLEIQCLMKLEHSALSVAAAMFRARIAYMRHGNDHICLSHRILAFIYRKARCYLQSASATFPFPAVSSIGVGETFIGTRLLRLDGGLSWICRTSFKVPGYSSTSPCDTLFC